MPHARLLLVLVATCGLLANPAAEAPWAADCLAALRGQRP